MALMFLNVCLILSISADVRIPLSPFGSSACWDTQGADLDTPTVWTGDSSERYRIVHVVIMNFPVH